MSGDLIALGVVAFYLSHTILFWQKGRKPDAKEKHDQCPDRDFSVYPGFEQSARLIHFASTLGRHYSTRIPKSTH